MADATTYLKFLLMTPAILLLIATHQGNITYHLEFVVSPLVTTRTQFLVVADYSPSEIESCFSPSLIPLGELISVFN